LSGQLGQGEFVTGGRRCRALFEVGKLPEECDQRLRFPALPRLRQGQVKHEVVLWQKTLGAGQAPRPPRTVSHRILGHAESEVGLCQMLDTAVGQKDPKSIPALGVVVGLFEAGNPPFEGPKLGLGSLQLVRDSLEEQACAVGDRPLLFEQLLEWAESLGSTPILGAEFCEVELEQAPPSGVLSQQDPGAQGPLPKSGVSQPLGDELEEYPGRGIRRPRLGGLEEKVPGSRQVACLQPLAQGSLDTRPRPLLGAARDVGEALQQSAELGAIVGALDERDQPLQGLAEFGVGLDSSAKQLDGLRAVAVLLLDHPRLVGEDRPFVG